MMRAWPIIFTRTRTLRYAVACWRGRNERTIPSFARTVMASTFSTSAGGECGSYRCIIIARMSLASSMVKRFPMHERAPALKGTELKGSTVASPSNRSGRKTRGSGHRSSSHATCAPVPVNKQV